MMLPLFGDLVEMRPLFRRRLLSEKLSYSIRPSFAVLTQCSIIMMALNYLERKNSCSILKSKWVRNVISQKRRRKYTKGIQNSFLLPHIIMLDYLENFAKVLVWSQVNYTLVSIFVIHFL